MSNKKLDKKSNIGILDKQKNKLQPPKKFKVILHNDDYTSMNFVINILEKIFHKSAAEATRIMLTIHNSGKGIAGVYTREIAETKCAQVRSAAIQHSLPLLSEIEAE